MNFGGDGEDILEVWNLTSSSGSETASAFLYLVLYSFP